MKKNITMIISLLVICGCNTPILNNNPNNSKLSNSISNKLIVNNKKSEIHGLVIFPKTIEQERKTFQTKSKLSNNKYRFITKATINQISENSTVSFIDSNSSNLNNKVVETTLSNPDGTFDISFGTNNFDPEINKIYTLEASKRIGTSGDEIITIRTFVRWNGNNWDSIVQSGLIINEYTTAISIIQGYNSSTISKEDVLGKLIFNDNIFSPLSFSNIGIGQINKVANYVLLSIYQARDPYNIIRFANDDYYLEQSESFKNFLTTDRCEGCKFSQSDLQNYDFRNKDLAYADFSGLNLYGIDFSNSILYKANLSGTYSNQNTKYIDSDLTGVNFSGSNLYNVNFSNLSLYNVNFSYSYINNNKFENSDLTHANFSSSTISNPNINNATLDSVSFRNVNFNYLTLTNKTFLNNDFTGTNFYEGEYSGIDFIGSNFNGSTLFSNFYNCKFDLSNFKGAILDNARFSYSDFGSSSFENVSLVGTRFPETNLDKVDFSLQNLSGVSLSGAILKGQDLSDKDLSNSNFSFTDLSNANLSNSNITNTRFDNVLYLGTKMPDGTLSTYTPISKITYKKNNEVYVLNQLNKELVKLTNNNLEDSSPIITKDDNKIIYVEKNTSGNRDIYIVNSNGTDATNLTSDTSTRDNYEPVLSDDGTKIIYTSKENGFSNIYKMNLNGTDKINITATTNKINKEPTTFGNKVVYISDDEVYQISLDGTSLLQLTSSSDYGICTKPKFSPNGTKISFLSNTNKDNKNINDMKHIWVVNSENTNLSADAIRLTRYTVDSNDYNTISGVDNYFWSSEKNLAYSTYIGNDVRSLFRVYLDTHSLNNRITYEEIDSELLGVMKTRLDKFTAKRPGGVIYYLQDGKIISYDIDFGITEELAGN